MDTTTSSLSFLHSPARWGNAGETRHRRWEKRLATTAFPQKHRLWAPCGALHHVKQVRSDLVARPSHIERRPHICPFWSRANVIGW